MSLLPPPCQTPEPRHSLTRARLYPAGWLCDRHSPWARRGLPEPVPGPGWPAGAWTTPIGQGVASLLDERAIASGKRRSRPEDYRAAQAATTHHTPRTPPDMRIGHRCKCRHGDLSHHTDKNGKRACNAAGCDTRCHRNPGPELLPTFDAKGNVIERIVPPGDRLGTEGDAGGPLTCDCDGCQALYAEMTGVGLEPAGA